VSNRRLGVVAVLAAAILLPVSVGHAQSIPPSPPSPPSPGPSPGANSNFAALPGLSRTQQITAAAIQRVCEQLTPVTPAQVDLSQRCSEMVQNSNALQGSGPTSLSLGLSEEGLAAVVSRIAPDEIPSQGTGAVELSSNQFRALAGRLATLRSGAPGISLTSLKLDIGGRSLTADRLLGQPEVGGGASADSPGGGRLGLFATASYAFGDKDGTTREVGFDYDSWGVLTGVDYRLTPSLIIGLAGSYTSSDADLDDTLGSTDTKSYGVTLYGSYYVGSLYVDLFGGYTYNKYDTIRKIVYPGVDREAKGDTNGNQFNVGAGVGYVFYFGGLSATPYGRIEYLNLDIDGYTERGADGLDLTLKGQSVESLQTALGAVVAYAISVPFGVLQPQVRAEWRHEFLNDSRSVTARFTNDPFNTFFAIPTNAPDRDYAAVGAGLTAVFKQGVSAFVNYETIVGLKDVAHHEFTGGIRVEF
jgi:outer membrane lipase/esterase